ncbi:hypothetical protein ASC77_02275 [Nocardioides sp. Root1257]|nr:hypothetical protein ASC77_02275 [Nocardioides sp. Root1257]KRC55834.1 hypothetical protein ASE24_02275 [Nocardioides sp. Root224]
MLPLAAGIAASPIPVIPAILVLAAPRPRATGSAYLGGWLAGMTVMVLAATVLASVLEQGETPTWAIVVRLVLGLLLIGLGVRKWLGRAADAGTPAWMESLRTTTPRRSFRLALTLAVANPKHLMLAFAAGLYAGASDLEAAGLVLAAVLFIAVASVSVAVPILAFLVLGDRAQPPLQRVEAWLVRHNAVLLAVVVIVIGAALVLKAVQEL